MYIQADKDKDDSTNVVQEHRRRNRAVRPPKIEQLVGYDDMDACDQDDDPDAASESQRAKRYSKWDNVIKPTTLHYYPTYWQEVLNCSKKKMQHEVAPFQAFPNCEKDLNIATCCVRKILAEFESEGGLVEDGVLSSHISFSRFMLF